MIERTDGVIYYGADDIAAMDTDQFGVTSPGWYFWDEIESTCHGPWTSCIDALCELKKYCDKLTSECKLANRLAFGTKMIYREDDWKAEVEVIEDKSDDQVYCYKLKVIRTLRSSNIFNHTPDGTLFDCSQQRDAGAYSGMWILSQE